MNLQQLRKIMVFYGRFTPSYTQIGYRARSLLWRNPKADFSGQHWVVTGASGGLGRFIALEAARLGATVTAVARSQAKLDQVVADGRAQGHQRIDTALCDFSLQTDTQRLVRDLAARGRPIDVLVNNVGLLNHAHVITAEGREHSYTTNLLSHYVLTEGLIRAGAFRKERPLVINMTSGGGYNVALSTRALNTLDPKKFNGTLAYGWHKRAQMVLNQHWRDTYGPKGFTFYVMHPGWADTDGVKTSLPRFREVLKSVLRDARSGTDTALWLAAVRPPQREEESVWFDRKQRAAHVYPHTRTSKDTPQTLVAYLDADVARVADAG
ncbi:MAG: SDR family NAD(P)-dependent oxidoreductase [Rhodoferax sp.]|jgi:dehydrogenase/reductase SDR family protein 12|nr:SDR family NAD(P)-dependent oxidoreductase [Rhodoferax sp.]